MNGNPLIQRYRYSTLRPKQFWIYTAIYISITLLLISMSYSGYKYQTFFGDITEFFNSLYYQFLIFQVLMLFIWATFNSGSAIKEEILNKSFDFFKMLPLPAHKKALGILIGKNLLVILFGAINLVFLVYFGLAAKININLQGQILLTVISITILANLTSLLSSINPAKKSKSSNMVLVLLIVFFLAPMTINAVLALSSLDELQSYTVNFFKIKCPILLLISLIALYFSCWLFKGILRKFTHEQKPLFTRKAAMLFLVGYIFIVLGLFYVYIPKNNASAIYSYWFITLPPVLLVPFGSLRKIDNYIEYSRNLQSNPKSEKTSISAMLMHSNLLLVIALFSVWAVSSIGITFLADYANMKPLSCSYDIFILLTACVFLALLLELYVVYMTAFSKIGLLTGFIALLYLILPVILAAIFKNSTIRLYSPLGFMASFFGKSDTSTTIKNTLWLINIMLCVGPAFLVWKRYNYILEQRQRM